MFAQINYSRYVRSYIHNTRLTKNKSTTFNPYFGCTLYSLLLLLLLVLLCLSKYGLNIVDVLRMCFVRCSKLTIYNTCKAKCLEVVLYVATTKSYQNKQYSHHAKMQLYFY